MLLERTILTSPSSSITVLPDRKITALIYRVNSVRRWSSYLLDIQLYATRLFSGSITTG